MASARLIASACSVCLGLAAAGPVWSQQTSNSPAPPQSTIHIEPASALREGVGHFNKGDYDKASLAFSVASSGQETLMPQDRKVLQNFVQKTNMALRARTEASMNLNQAEVLFNEGKTAQGQDLLAQVQSNAYTSAQDRQRAEGLAAKFGTRSKNPLSRLFGKKEKPRAYPTSTPTTQPNAGPATEQMAAAANRAPATMQREDATFLLSEARKFYSKGYYDQAETYAKQAKAYTGPWSSGDTPDKVLKDCEDAKSKSGLGLGGSLGGGGAGQSVVGGAGFGGDAARSMPANTVAKSMPGQLPGNLNASAKQISTESMLDSAVKPVAAKPNDLAPPKPMMAQTSSPAVDDKAEARNLYDAGLEAMKNDNPAQAHQCFLEAQKNAEGLNDIQRGRLPILLSTTDPKNRMSVPGRARASDNSDLSFTSAQDNKSDKGGDQDLINKVRQQEQAELQRLTRATNDAMLKASHQLRSEPAQALATLNGALREIQSSELDRRLTEPLVRQLEKRIKTYNLEKSHIEMEQLDRERAKAVSDARKRGDLNIIDKQRNLKALSEKYDTLMKKGDYQSAIQVAQQAIEVDPDEVWAYAAVWKATQMRHYTAQEELEQLKRERWWKTLYEVEKSAIPFPDDPQVTYIAPKDWEQLTIRRQKWRSATFEEKTEAIERIERALEKTIDLQYNETPLSEVLDFLRDFHQINIIPDEQALKAANVELTDNVTLTVAGIKTKNALKLLLDPRGLTYLIENEVLKITDKESANQKLSTKVYPVADLVMPVLDFNSGGVGLGGALGGGNTGQGGLGGGGFGGFGGGGGGAAGGGGGGAIGGGGGGGGLGQGGGGGAGGGAGGGNLGASGGNLSQDVIDLITRTVDPDSWEDNGGDGRIEYFDPTRAFVVTQSQATHDKIADLLTQLRKLQDIQIAVEVRFITVTETFFERIGIDFDVEIDNNNDRYIQNALNGGNSPPGTSLNLPIGRSPTGQVLSDGNHVRGVTVGRNAFGQVPNNFNIPISQSSFDLATVPLAGISSPALGGTNFGIAFLNDIDVYLLLEAVQADRRSMTLNAPKVTMQNGQTAAVAVTQQVPFVTDVLPVISAGAVTFDPIITTLNNGTTLQVQAAASADRRYVRLNLAPVLQTIDSIANPRTISVQGTAGGGGGLGGGGGGTAGAGTATATVQLPIVSVNTVLTTVTVPDGGTIVMGGLKTHNESRNEFGTPVLSKIPYLNRLFKNAATGRESTSLLLMATPHILILEEEEEKLGVNTRPGY